MERIKAGDGWRILNKIVYLNHNRYESMNVVVPLQLMQLFTKQQYLEMDKASKLEEEERQRLEREEAKKRKDKSVAELLCKTKPRFGTVDATFQKLPPAAATAAGKNKAVGLAADETTALLPLLTAAGESSTESRGTRLLALPAPE